MKILHICTPWPVSFQGGITNYVSNLAEMQYKMGDEVTVIGGPDKVQHDYNYIEFKSKLEPFSLSNYSDKDSYLFFKQFLLNNKFDIIHIHALYSIDWNIFQLLKNTNYVVSLHDYGYICPYIYMDHNPKGICSKYDETKCLNCLSGLEQYTLINKFVNKIYYLFKIKIHLPHTKQEITTKRYTRYKKLLENAKCVLPVSTRVKEIYKDSGINANYVVLHIGNITAENFPKTFSYNVQKDKIRIVFLGRMTHSKGADLFLELADKTTNDHIEYHFLGYAAEYENKLKSHKIINDGSYKQSDLPNLLKNYDMGMVLSIWEDNAPQVVMELLNNRVPVIATKMGGITDFVNNSNGYIFNPYSEDEKNKAINFINNLTPEQILRKKNSIHRTTTFKEHYIALNDIYKNIIR